MIEIETAWDLIQQVTQTNSAVRVSLTDAIGRTSHADLQADVDSPPFDKSLVDGFAISELDPAQPHLEIVERVTAGQVPSRKIGTGQATQIMTGCPIPAGAAGVVMVEQTTQVDDHTVKIDSIEFRPQQNILEQGSVIRSGEVFLNKDRTVRPHHVGALAEFGVNQIDVYRQPTVAVLATGDELVEPGETPGPGQIRNSNGTLLKELAKSAGAQVVDLGIGRDNPDSLNEKISKGLESDLLVIAGGVSAGVLDLIPQCLQQNKVDQVFHKINLKPGKPLWFGQSPGGTLVFGLPGNPISSLVCFKLFVEPTIARQSGQTGWLDFQEGVIDASFSFRGGRRTFWPAQNVNAQGLARLLPLDWKGSADQVTFLKADGLLSLGTEAKEWAAGDRIEYVRLY